MCFQRMSVSLMGLKPMPHVTTEPAPSSPAIAQDIPCVTCGYNLRGLDPTKVCPECGTPIQRSVDARLKLMMSSPRIWARLVLGGLVVWLMLTPYFICTALVAGRSLSGNTTSFQWLNYPGPKVWAVPLVLPVDLGRSMSGVNFLSHVLAMVMLIAVYLITWPRHPGSGIEPPLNMRMAARWSSTVLMGGFIMICIDPMGSLVSPVLGTFAIVFVELPCTLLIYRCLSTLARRLDLSAEARLLRHCGWVAAFAMTVSVVMIITDYQVPIANFALSWCFGAVIGTAAVIATGSLIRVAMALWPLAMSKSSATMR